MQLKRINDAAHHASNVNTNDTRAQLCLLKAFETISLRPVHKCVTAR